MRLGSVVYHCKRISSPNDEIEEFAEPKKYILRLGYLTIQPNSGNVFQSSFGELKDYDKRMCAIPYQKWEKEINEGDRFYLEIEPNLSQEFIEQFGYGYDANYKVVKRNPQNVAIMYALKSLVE